MTPRPLPLLAAIDVFQRAGMSGDPERLKAALVVLCEAIEGLGPPPPDTDAVRHLVSFVGGSRAYALFCGAVIGGRVERLRELGEAAPWAALLNQVGAADA